MTRGGRTSSSQAPAAVMADAICEVHRRFGELLPPELLKVENPDTGEVLDGQLPGHPQHGIADTPTTVPTVEMRRVNVKGHGIYRPHPGQSTNSSAIAQGLS